MLKTVAVFMMLALAACAQGTTSQTPTPYAPASPENRDRGMDM